MRKKFYAAVTLYDKEEDMVIGTLMIYKKIPMPWMPSNRVLLFNGDGYSSDTGYTVIVTVVGNQSKTGIRVFIEGQAYNAAIKAYE